MTLLKTGKKNKKQCHKEDFCPNPFWGCSCPFEGHRQNPKSYLFLLERSLTEVDQVHAMLCTATAKSQCSFSQIYPIRAYNGTVSVPYLCLKPVEYLFTVGIHCNRKCYFTKLCKKIAMLTVGALRSAFYRIKTVSYIAVSKMWLPIVSYINENLFKGINWTLLVQDMSSPSFGLLRLGWSGRCQMFLVDPLLMLQS